jgi:hypothetical protein
MRIKTQSSRSLPPWHHLLGSCYTRTSEYESMEMSWAPPARGPGSALSYTRRRPFAVFFGGACAAAERLRRQHTQLGHRKSGKRSFKMPKKKQTAKLTTQSSALNLSADWEPDNDLAAEPEMVEIDGKLRLCACDSPTTTNAHAQLLLQTRSRRR